MVAVLVTALAALAAGIAVSLLIPDRKADLATLKAIQKEPHVSIPYDTIEKRAATIAGLRELADFLEVHPEVPTQREVELHISVDAGGDEAERVEVERIAALLGVLAGPPYPGSAHYQASRTFGPENAQVCYRATAIPEVEMARYDALVSYRDCVQPEQEVSS